MGVSRYGVGGFAGHYQPRDVPSAMSEKKAPLQSIARKICQVSDNNDSAMNKQWSTNPVDPNDPSSPLPHLAIRGQQARGQQDSRDDPHHQHRSLITTFVYRLS